MHSRIITDLNMGANWYYLLQEAKQSTGYDLNDNLENYLILTLNNFSPESHDFSNSVCVEFMQAASEDRKASYNKLREVGDQCLLINGMFPEISLKRNVSLNYYAVIGKQAYNTLAAKSNINSSNDIDTELFNGLSIHFVGLTDLLHTMLHLKN